jgi:chromosome partitioning protein
MKDIIAIINQKGGVAKTTTTLALGAGLFMRGQKLLYVDLDAQGNLTYTLGANDEGLTVFDVLIGSAKAEQTVQHTKDGDVIPASQLLSGADIVITSAQKEYRLKEAIKPLNEHYDYILIDTPPSLGILTINALTACTGVIIPAQADTYSLRGIRQLQNTITTVKEHCNPFMTIKGILLTRYNPRTILSRDITEIMEQVAQQLQTKLFTSSIRETILIKESQAQNQSIYNYAPKSNAVSDYEAFITELLERN